MTFVLLPFYFGALRVSHFLDNFVGRRWLPGSASRGPCSLDSGFTGLGFAVLGTLRNNLYP